MAILKRLPEKSIIRGFAGIVDFYVYGACRGRPIICARAWPRMSKENQTQATKEAAKTFAYIKTNLKNLPPNIVNAFKVMAGGTELTWQDMAVRAYFNGDKI